MRLTTDYTMGQIVHFKTVFPNEIPKEPSEYLKGIDKSFLIDFATEFSSIDRIDSKKTAIATVVSLFFNRQNFGFAKDVYRKILKFKNEREVAERKPVFVFIINPVSTLMLFELIYKHTEAETTISEEEEQRNLFKLYLLLNERQNGKEGLAAKSTAHLEYDLQISMMTFCLSFYQFDLINYNKYETFVCQYIKSILLLEWMHNEPRTQHLLSSFLSRFKCVDYNQYLKTFAELTKIIVEDEKEKRLNIFIPEVENYDWLCSFMENLCIDENKELDQYDFLSIRSRPFYKVKKGVFRVIFKQFVQELVFKGLYFILDDVNKKLNKSNTIPKPEQIKDFKPVYGEKFSEQILVYNILNRIFFEICTKFEGREIKAMGIDAEPDYYVRRGRDIFLFESKDFFIIKDVKHSYDFTKYETEFKKRLYTDDGKNGAIQQLIKNIKRLQDFDFPEGFDDDYNYKEVNIYPILIVNDSIYNTFGLNVLVDYWLQTELRKIQSEGYFTHKIKRIVVLPIDTLIMYQDHFINGTIKLNEIIDKWISHTKRMEERKQMPYAEFEKKMADRTVPFTYYLIKYIKEKNLGGVPSMAFEFVQKLLGK